MSSNLSYAKKFDSNISKSELKKKILKDWPSNNVKEVYELEGGENFSIDQHRSIIFKIDDKYFSLELRKDIDNTIILDSKPKSHYIIKKLKNKRSLDMSNDEIFDIAWDTITKHGEYHGINNNCKTFAINFHKKLGLKDPTGNQTLWVTIFGIISGIWIFNQ